MATVYTPNKYKDLAERLGKRQIPGSDRPIFTTYMHLMVFAAMVGYMEREKTELDAKNRGGEIGDHIFVNNNMDGAAYLLAIHDEKNGDILREKNDNDCWKIIEQYSAKGFEIINNWMIQNPGDTDGVDTLLNKLKELVPQDVVDNTGTEKPIDF